MPSLFLERLKFFFGNLVKDLEISTQPDRPLSRTGRSGWVWFLKSFYHRHSENYFCASLAYNQQKEYYQSIHIPYNAQKQILVTCVISLRVASVLYYAATISPPQKKILIKTESNQYCYRPLQYLYYTIINRKSCSCGFVTTRFRC